MHPTYLSQEKSMKTVSHYQTTEEPGGFESADDRVPLRRSDPIHHRYAEVPPTPILLRAIQREVKRAIG